VNEFSNAIYLFETIGVNGLVSVHSSRLCDNIEMRRNDPHRLDGWPAMCHLHYLSKIESVFFCPLPPVPLDEGCRVDEDAVIIKYDGIAMELFYVCDFPIPSYAVLGFSR
jgi:hypothetical protein